MAYHVKIFHGFKRNFLRIYIWFAYLALISANRQTCAFKDAHFLKTNILQFRVFYYVFFPATFFKVYATINRTRLDSSEKRRQPLQTFDATTSSHRYTSHGVTSSPRMQSHHNTSSPISGSLDYEALNARDIPDLSRTRQEQRYQPTKLKENQYWV